MNYPAPSARRPLSFYAWMLMLCLTTGAFARARSPAQPSSPPNAGLIKILRAAGICPADGECTPTPDKLKLLEAAAKATEQWEPVPPKVLPGAADSAPPSDAIILFDGHNLDQWISTNDRTPARWPVSDGVLTVDKALGNIETKQHFTNYQLHLEWRIPQGINGEGQRRGNSGVFLASTGPGDDGYEIQILDSWNNPTYVNGQAASIYKQAAPLVNASRPPGEWQSYDIVWMAPIFSGDGSLQRPAYVTVVHNGVLVQNHVRLQGETVYIGKPFYKPYAGAGIKLQAHSDPSTPSLSFRNIWVRPIADTDLR
jgi:hypothetical protein